MGRKNCIGGDMMTVIPNENRHEKGMHLQRDERGRFLHGNRGGGRTRLPEEIKEIFVTATPTAAKYLVSIITNESERTEHRIRASEIILNRVYGMPKQSVEAIVDSNINTPSIDLSHLSVDDLLKIANMKTDEIIEVENITIGADE